MKIQEITSFLERQAPLALQEEWDNCGIQVGDPSLNLTSVLFCLELTPAVLEEAISQEHNLIIAHHPMIFKGVKKIVPGTELSDMIIKAIKHDICIYSAHTNLDSMIGGVSYALAHKLGMQNLKPLSPVYGAYYKLVVFVPQGHSSELRQALFAAGAGRQGNYDSCSFQQVGTGTFRPNEQANPFIGKSGEMESVQEDRLEFLVKDTDLKRVERVLLQVHPYEEPAYDVIKLERQYVKAGLGVYGELPNPMETNEWLQQVKSLLGSAVRHNGFSSRQIQKVALCGGSGAFLIGKAASLKMDAYLCGDIKYHEFFGYDDRMLIADVGHYETEYFALELLQELLATTYPQLSTAITHTTTNPIKYL